VSDIEGARKKWITEQAVYDAFAEHVAAQLALAVQAKGIWCETSSRAKETHSLVKKLLRGKHTYENIPDKAGARCIVRHLSEIAGVIDAAGELFECSLPDRKVENLAEDRVGYSSTHLQIRLRVDSPEEVKYPRDRFTAELQIRTLGQHLWAEMSHDAIYKNDETVAKLPSGVRRRVNLMSGLIEVADQEFDRIGGELPTNPAAQLYKALERHYYKLATRRPDPELSLEVIGLLEPLYSAEVPEIARRIDSFFMTHELTLHTVFAHAEEWRASAFFYQPEVIMIYERLEADPINTRKLWNTKFPEAELESIANAFGISFD
jgi:ppGpp synthetase/RelA/SpoT-type nucleotidyltranferase